ncbi:DUF4376 domain-containing protein [Hoylesella shahii]|jgi:hypothetical protein|uniref:Uncharacterized protein DUF4376 n=1 Tax=Hoylesella shahii DSM 15611 = JCM 12083 TaxID=1122991 RepID=A0A318HZ58_9BACT|nr:DUF4376 domain-containing protein [Hoylesella shahii]PXX23622.1 uncharacterized protein DUF4376 [Hoylesella shahii DSM 15611 = JCM 12083]
MRYVDNEGNLAPNNIVVDGMMVINPTAEQYEKVGYMPYIEPMPTEEELLNQAVENKVAEIKEYDKSPAVNSFKLNGMDAWINREDRIGTRRAIELDKVNGQTESDIWLNGFLLRVNCDLALQLLDAVGHYAYKAYNCTQAHIHAVRELKSIEEVQKYDYKVGYPEKLNLRTM